MKTATKRAIDEIEHLAARAKNDPQAKGNRRRREREEFQKLLDQTRETLLAHGFDGWILLEPYMLYVPDGRIAIQGEGVDYDVENMIQSDGDFEEYVEKLNAALKSALRDLGIRAA